MSDGTKISSGKRYRAATRALGSQTKQANLHSVSRTVEYWKLCNHALMRWRLLLPLLATELGLAGRR